MIALSPEAEAQLDALIAHDVALGGIEASIHFVNALEQVTTRISQRPDAGLSTPRPYSAIAKAGCRSAFERRATKPEDRLVRDDPNLSLLS